MPSIIEISDLTDPRLDLFARLTEAQLRNRLEPEKGIFIAESPKVIQLALDAGHAPVAFLMERKHVQGQAHEDACSLEHAISRQSFAVLKDRLEGLAAQKAAD